MQVEQASTGSHEESEAATRSREKRDREKESEESRGDRERKLGRRTNVQITFSVLVTID